MVGIQCSDCRSHREHCDKQVLGKLNVLKQEVRQPLLYGLEGPESWRGVHQVLLIDFVLLLAEFQIAPEGFANGFRIRR